MKANERLEKEYKRFMSLKSASILKELSKKEKKENSIDNDWWCHVNSDKELHKKRVNEFRDRVDWAIVCSYQELSENFIRDFQNEVDWGFY